MTGSGDAPLRDDYGREPGDVLQRQAELRSTAWRRRVVRHSESGQPGARSIKDTALVVFSRAEILHNAGCEPFLKAPFVEDVRSRTDHDVIVFGSTRRPETRSGQAENRESSKAAGRLHASGAFPIDQQD